jgi:hypothetical protein
MKVNEARAAAAVQSSLPKAGRRGANGEPTSRRNSPRTDGSNPVPSSGESMSRGISSSRCGRGWK